MYLNSTSLMLNNNKKKDICMMGIGDRRLNDVLDLLPFLLCH